MVDLYLRVLLATAARHQIHRGSAKVTFPFMRWFGSSLHTRFVRSLTWWVNIGGGEVYGAARLRTAGHFVVSRWPHRNMI
jgi:hypothetical protein